MTALTRYALEGEIRRLRAESRALRAALAGLYARFDAADGNVVAIVSQEAVEAACLALAGAAGGSD